MGFFGGGGENYMREFTSPGGVWGLQKIFKCT